MPHEHSYDTYLLRTPEVCFGAHIADANRKRERACCGFQGQNQYVAFIGLMLHTYLISKICIVPLMTVGLMTNPSFYRTKVYEAMYCRDTVKRERGIPESTLREL